MSHSSSFTSPSNTSTKTISFNNTPINIPSRSIDLNSNSNYSILTTQTLTPLMSCTPKGITSNTNITRRINSRVVSSSPRIIQPTPLVSPAIGRSQRVGSTVTRNMSSPNITTPNPFTTNRRNNINTTLTNVTSSNLEDFLSRMHLPSYHVNTKNEMKPR